MNISHEFTHDDLVNLMCQVIRLRQVERAARIAMNLAKAGRSMDAYHALESALEPPHVEPIREVA